MEDAQIVDLYWQRSEQAVPETEKKYGAYCRAIAARICRDARDAEECVNDTWLGAWNAMPAERPQRLGSFLGCLTRHLAIGRRRAEETQKRGGGEFDLALEELAECLPGGEDPAKEAEARELGRTIAAFADGLRPDERHVFLGRYWYFLPTEEISRRCGFSEAKTRSMLHRLRIRLRRELIKEGLL